MVDEIQNPEPITTQNGVSTSPTLPTTQIPAPTNQVVPQGKSPRVRKSFLIVSFLVFAVFLVLGLVAISMLNKQPENTQLTVQEPTTTQKAELFLILDQTNLAQAVDGEVLITGKTLPNSTVMLVSDVDDEALESNAEGIFEGTVLISKDAKTIKVTAYDENGAEESVVLETLVQEG